MKSAPPKLRVKVLTRCQPGHDNDHWFERFPGGIPTWGNCDFVFDRHCREYDWLVVYNDLPSVKGERQPLWEEPLACPRANTLFITYEPSTITVYGNGFLRQFGWVLTSQEPWVIDHPGVIYEQPSLIWYYGIGSPRGAYDSLVKNVPLKKSSEISAVCSNKRQRNTLHRRRYDFIMNLRKQLPEMELFGRGIRYIQDKADALDSFKYHVALENFFGPHHWTEKLADPFLGACMPVYYGCPNAEEYFPPESFLRIDIDDAGSAVETIRRAIRDRAFEKNLDAILESRRRLLEEYGLVPHIARIVSERHRSDAPPPGPNDTIMSRYLFRRRSVRNLLGFARERTAVRLKHRLRTAGAKK